MDIEIGSESTASVTESSPAASTPAPSIESAPQQAAQPQPEPKAPPAPELSLREKIQKKAEDVAAKRAKDPKTGQFQSKKAPTETPAPSLRMDGQAPPAVEKSLETSAYTPNFKLKVMEQERDIPEFLRPLIKDAESEKQVREIMEKAYGLEYVKPKFEQARQQLQTVSGENQAIKGQINNLVSLYKRGDIDGWLDQLGVPQERLLQWMADKINYQQLPADQKAILDARKTAEDRAYQAESQATRYQQTNEQLLTQQVQTALESSLARPDVNAVATTFDQRHGTGAFRAEIQRRGDYIWKTKGELVSPDKLVSEFLGFLGPVSQSAPASPQGAPLAQQTPPTQSAPPQQQAKTPVIPNISGRSASALPAKPVKSIDDIRAKYKEMQSAGR